MECLQCGQTYSTDSMATAKQCSGCARIEALEAENAALREALVEISNRPSKMTWGEPHEVHNAMRDMEDIADAALARQTEGEG